MNGNKIGITKNNKIYQKIVNSLDNTPNQSCKFRLKNCFEINGELHGMYNHNNQTKLKTLMIRSRSCDYGEAYVLVKKLYKSNH